MGSLVAILRKDGGDATYEALNMLRMTAHGVFDFFSIASWKGSIASRSLSSIEGNISPSSIVLGHKFVKTLPNDALQSMVDGGLALLFEGRLYSDLNISDIESALKEVRENPERGAARLLWKRDGAFVFILSTKDLLIIGRDSVGLRPLYYGEDEKVCAVASERKAFIPLGMSDVKPFPPGHLAYVNAEGFKFRCIRTVTQPEISSLAMDEAVAMLRRYLFEAVKTCTSDLKSIAVAFSGGLDSSVLARVCSLLWKEVELFMVTLEGAEDVEKAKNIANELGLPINVRVYGVEDIAERLSEVPWITESPSPLDNAVAIPILWVAESARSKGYRVLLLGQGCDEVFAGYNRYLNVYRDLGCESVVREVFNDVKDAYNKNLDRDVKVCDHAGVEPRFPYMNYKLVEFALSLPFSLKISSPNDRLRKSILRSLAHEIGVPEMSIKAKKRAIQYSTGVSKALRKLARERRMNVRDFLYTLYKESVSARLSRYRFM